MKAERIGYLGRGPARKLGRRETLGARKARLAAQGRDLAAERRRKPGERPDPGQLDSGVRDRVSFDSEQVAASALARRPERPSLS